MCQKGKYLDLSIAKCFLYRDLIDHILKITKIFDLVEDAHVFDSKSLLQGWTRLKKGCVSLAACIYHS